MADDDLLNQGDIEQLLKQSASADAAAGAGTPGETSDSAATGTAAGEAAAPAQASPSTTATADTPAGQEDLDKRPSGDGGKSPAASGRGQDARSPREATVRTAPADATEGQDAIAQDDIDYLLRQAEQALASIDAESPGGPPSGMSSFRLETFSGAPPSTDAATLDLLRDVNLDVRIELGRTHMYLEDVLRLRKGSVVPLDKLAGDPVDIFVNGRLIARGEVLVLNDNFCVRVAELIAGVPAGAA